MKHSLQNLALEMFLRYCIRSNIEASSNIQPHSIMLYVAKWLIYIIVLAKNVGIYRTPCSFTWIRHFIIFLEGEIPYGTSPFRSLTLSAQ